MLCFPVALARCEKSVESEEGGAGVCTSFLLGTLRSRHVRRLWFLIFCAVVIVRGFRAGGP